MHFVLMVVGMWSIQLAVEVILALVSVLIIINMVVLALDGVILVKLTYIGR